MPTKNSNPPAGWTPVDETAGWTPVDEGPSDPYAANPPGVPGVPVPTALKGTPAPPAPTFGSSPKAVASTVGQHFKNFVAGPYNAITQGPQSQAEQDVVNAGGGGLFGRYVGLPADRLLGASASVQNAQNAAQQWKAGDHEGAFQSGMDAVPVVGPWARNIENDVQQKGAVAGMAGLATDIFGPSAAGRVAGMALKPAAQAVARGDVANMVKPSAADSAFGKSPAEGLLNQPGGVMSWSKPQLLARTQRNISNLGQQIGDEINSSPQISNRTDVAAAVDGPFNDALQRAAQNNEVGLVNNLKDAQQGYTHNLFFDQASGEIGGQTSPTNMNMTPNDLFDLKKRVGDNIRWTNQAFDNDLNATRGQVYGGLKDALNQAVPSIKPLNEQYANMRAGASALERRIPIEERNNVFSIPDTAIGAGGVAAGHPAAAGFIAARKLFTSQPVRSVIDQGLWKYGTSAPNALQPSLARLLFVPPSGSRTF